MFDSNILKNTYLNKDKPMRLLDVDNRLYVSMKHPIDLYVTTNDVIHSYAVPSFGIKLDSLPGRINYGCTFVLRPGIYYGQCSELCGINHAYMPTSVVVLDKYKSFESTELLEHLHLFQIQCQN
jgi:heme/copper-type cytochrome/quinol oxidase subunit 2